MGDTMNLVDVKLPSPSRLRGGWAAFAAIMAAIEMADDVYAEKDQWFYHDGCNNWACLRMVAPNQYVLVGHDRSHSNTYFRKAAKYFKEPETDLLAGAPSWWGERLDPKPFGLWIGFVYGWNGSKWQRAAYDKEDGFAQVGLLKACSISDTTLIRETLSEVMGKRPAAKAIRTLVSADANITAELLESVVPDMNVKAGVAAARKFLEMPL